MTAYTGNQVWYVGSTKWTSVAAWAASTSYSAGALVRQNTTPTTGYEKVFVCIVAGTSAGSEPAWSSTLATYGEKFTDNTVTWMECTARAGLNGDSTNCPYWSAVKGLAVVIGQVIQRASQGSYQICTTAGTCGSGSEPSFSNTAGVTTADGGTVVWTSLGVQSGFAAYAAPAARLYPFLALSVGYARGGDTVYVSNNHAETQASAIAYSAQSTQFTPPLNIVCVTDTAVPPTATNTTASVTTTGASALSFGHGCYTYGVVLNCGTGATAESLSLSPASGDVYEDCTFNLVNTGSGAFIDFGGTGVPSSSQHVACTYTFAATTQSVKLNLGVYDIVNPTIAASGSVPTTAFAITNPGTVFHISDADLSNLTGTLFSSPGNPGYVSYSKLNAGVTKAPASVGNQAAGYVWNKVVYSNCDSGATNYKLASYGILGTILTNASIYRNGGATDGTTPQSWQMTSGANASYGAPYQSEEIVEWCTFTSGSHTATIYLTTSTLLNNNTFWAELEYLGNASYPIGSRVSSRMALLGTPTQLSVDSTSTWNGTAQTYLYQIQLTFSPLMAGPVKMRLYSATPNAVYVDPLLNLA